MCLSEMKIVCAILGASNNQEGKLDSDAIDRCNIASELYLTNKNISFILCGGNGEHFNLTVKKHYEYLEDYICSLIEGIQHNIIGCVDSYNTIEDIAGILKILKEQQILDAKLIIVTNDYHVARSSYLLSKHNIKLNAYFYSTKTQYSDLWLKKRLIHEHKRILEYLELTLT